MAKKKEKITSVQYLRSVGDVFERGDWTFESGDEVLDVVYKSVRDRETLPKRTKRAFRWLFMNGGKNMRGLMGDSLWSRLRMFVYCFKHENHAPDGYLNQGGIVTQWCEDGEYIELMQPSVGMLVADFLEAEPEHPHAKLIRAEMDRIYNKKEWHKHYVAKSK